MEIVCISNPALKYLLLNLTEPLISVCINFIVGGRRHEALDYYDFLKTCYVRDRDAYPHKQIRSQRHQSINRMKSNRIDDQHSKQKQED